jgi:hypothetical protein
MDLLLEDIKSTLGASSVSLPALADGAKEGNAEHQALRDAVRRMRMTESDGGGVALHNVRPSSSGQHMSRTRGAVEAAG